MKNICKWALLMVIAPAAASMVMGAWARGHSDPPGQEDEEENEAVVKAPSRVSVVNGETVVTLDPAAQARLGLKIATLQITSMHKEFTAPATVLAVQDLVTSRQNYLTGETALHKAEIAAAVSRNEYERLKVLYQENRNASEKALDAAQAALRSGEADVQAARQQLGIETEAVRQSWGGAVADWVREGSPALQRILDQRELLIEVTLPAGHVTAAPRTASLEMSGVELPSATFVSSFPRVDPRVQGFSFLYIMPARSGLAPGTSLIARAPAGRKMRGVVVPAAAVVWRDSKAWTYVQTAPDRFARRAVPTGTSAPDGFFVTRGLAVGDKVVTSGAEMLLSAESGSTFQPED